MILSKKQRLEKTKKDLAKLLKDLGSARVARALSESGNFHLTTTKWRVTVEYYGLPEARSQLTPAGD